MKDGYTVETGVPVAKHSSIGWIPLGRALAEMDVGQSVLVTLAEMRSVRSKEYHRKYAHEWARRNGVKVVTRKTHAGLRIWRTA